MPGLLFLLAFSLPGFIGWLGRLLRLLLLLVLLAGCLPVIRLLFGRALALDTLNALN